MCVYTREKTGMMKPVYYGIVIQVGKENKLLKSLVIFSCVRA